MCSTFHTIWRERDFISDNDARKNIILLIFVLDADAIKYLVRQSVSDFILSFASWEVHPAINLIKLSVLSHI